jgi:hypothetical protein
VINYSANPVKTRVLLSDFYDGETLPNHTELIKLNATSLEPITGTELLNVDLEFGLGPWEINLLKF